MASRPEETLTAGIKLLDDLMRSHGFAYSPISAGSGSGGEFASGEYRRGDRRLELHYRYSLGLVTYHVGDWVVSHEDYMWSVLGKRWSGEYPGFSEEPLEGFRRLRRDLERHCTDFLAGSDSEFASRVQTAEALKKAAPHLP